MPMRWAEQNLPWVVVAVTDSVASVSDRITPADVAKVAMLARLTLTDDELATATNELGAMLDHFADIDALDLDGVEPMNNPTHLVNVMRDDVVGEVLDRDEVLAAAPVAQDNRFRVPPILGLDD
ncbi:MAG: aspartyl-tRNA(Asn)/glutamyl-tRNA(Gln) amidotransferase subunit C [Candidatus Aldehydirespiratoraceae bacterium]|jgi:aspartyl-tRNA(Asn)/glutamyl-tRNA(Gln) amidotransferase subunit C